MNVKPLNSIRTEIESNGPIRFDRFMELALYSPHGGFYTRNQLRSTKSGDFLTSPEVSPWFAKTLARFITTEILCIGEPVRLVEVGAGSGSLLRPLVDSLSVPLHSVAAIDIAPAARVALTKQGFEALDDLAVLPEGPPTILIANELLDNLPMRLAVRRDNYWAEQVVTIRQQGTLGLKDAEITKDALSWLENFAGDLPEGSLVEIQLRAAEWLETANQLTAGGTSVVIDYGGTMQELAPRRSHGTLRTYRNHHLGPDPLLEPGTTDITADVNFSALYAHGAATGSAEMKRQDDFLNEWGLSRVLARLREEELAAAGTGAVMRRLKVRSEFKDAQTLLHPRGLGDFRVLICRPHTSVTSAG